MTDPARPEDQEVDVVVLGAGPAGVGAAVAAAAHGARVTVVDENAAAGGQVYRTPPEQFRLPATPASPEAAEGRRQRRCLAASAATTVFGHRVWSVAGNLAVDAVGPDGLVRWRPRALVVANGTTERVMPFPGWTLPGVIGLAAATILLKSQHVLPGRSTIVAGAGPLLPAVAVGILKAGGRVEAVVDLSSRADWLKALPLMISRPDLLLQGAGWVATLARAGVSTYFRHAVTEVTQANGDLQVTIVPTDAAGRPRPDASRRTLTAECLAVGHGLVPATDVSRLLRARHRFDAGRGGWIAETDQDFRTSVKGLFVAGDAAGISGAVPAHYKGRIAGLAAARDLGLLSRAGFDSLVQPERRALAKADRFGRAAAGLMAPRSGLVETITRDTIVCRCEDVRRHEIDHAIADGARNLNQLKAWTRCGMGPCQGRTCGEAAASLLAVSCGSRETAGLWTGRAPLRPVPVEDIVGDYGYGDIPMPRSAPL